MFKKDISPGPKAKVKSSVQRALRQSLTTTYPLLAPHIDVVLPKKADLSMAKLPDRVALYILDSQPLFFQHDNGPLLPHLRLVHRFPHAFPSVRIDRGAVRFVLSGATLMAPGLTSAGGRLPEERGEDALVDGRWGRELEEGDPVVIMAEGKEEACAVGVLSVGTGELKVKKKGPAMEDGHYLGDGLWKMHVE
ncbi:probable translation machinery-associated protein 20 [Cephalotrichum gorgonifer]|uniref:Translation machinery-associated protein 20 n=1 Tax=Cephalotrichum gorgonifer TaxID=2041049 RepID=A0AAE8N0A7_9PEZI|nr:probable translation machinery-associated protein 20 [Cephalotrichum gorgonifer]